MGLKKKLNQTESFLIFFFLYTYHNEIIEQEDFSLVRGLFLGLVDVCHLKKSTTAHQSSVRDGENLRRNRRRALMTQMRRLRGFEVMKKDKETRRKCKTLNTDDLWLELGLKY